MIDRVRCVRGDLRDQALLERVLGEYEIATVIPSRGADDRRDRQPQPDLHLRDQHPGHLGAAGSVPRSPLVKQIVLASSDKAYGDHLKLPYRRETPLQGRHPYDVSKSCADLIGTSYAVTYGLPVVITRCGNFYGGGDLNWNRIVPGTIRSVLRGQRPIIRSDGTVCARLFLCRRWRGGLHAAGRIAGRKTGAARRGVQLFE